MTKGKLQAQIFETSPIYQELSQGVEEIDLFYVDQNNRPIGENTLTDWERGFFENSPGIENLWEMRHNLERGENGDRMKNAAQTEMENLKRWALERPTGQQIWAVERPQGSGLFILETWRR